MDGEKPADVAAFSARLTREKTLKAEWTGNGARSVSEFDPIAPRPDAPALVFALEDEDDGAAPTTSVVPGNFNRSLPKRVPGATTISTPASVSSGAAALPSSSPVASSVTSRE